MPRGNPGQRGGESCAVDYLPSVRAAPIPEDVRDDLLEIEGVQGVGLSGPETVRVYVSAASVQDRLPARLRGFKIEAEISGEFKLL